MKTIGLVLAKPPQYSETFFNLKIKGLQNHGHSIVVFTNAKKKGNHYFKHVTSYPTKIKDLARNPLCLLELIYSILFKSLKQAIRLYKLERKDGSSIFQSIKSIYFNH